MLQIKNQNKQIRLRSQQKTKERFDSYKVFVGKTSSLSVDLSQKHSYLKAMKYSKRSVLDNLILLSVFAEDNGDIVAPSQQELAKRAKIKDTKTIRRHTDCFGDNEFLIKINRGRKKTCQYILAPWLRDQKTVAALRAFLPSLRFLDERERWASDGLENPQKIVVKIGGGGKPSKVSSKTAQKLYPFLQNARVTNKIYIKETYNVESSLPISLLFSGRSCSSVGQQEELEVVIGPSNAFVPAVRLTQQHSRDKKEIEERQHLGNSQDAAAAFKGVRVIDRKREMIDNAAQLLEAGKLFPSCITSLPFRFNMEQDIWLLAFSEEVIKAARHDMSLARNLKHPFGYFLSRCKQHSKEKNQQADYDFAKAVGLALGVDITAFGQEKTINGAGSKRPSLVESPNASGNDTKHIANPYDLIAKMTDNHRNHLFGTNPKELHIVDRSEILQLRARARRKLGTQDTLFQELNAIVSEWLSA